MINCPILPVFQSSFTSNSFRIRIQILVKVSGPTVSGCTTLLANIRLSFRSTGRDSIVMEYDVRVDISDETGTLTRVKLRPELAAR
jgi:hypothetical protein